MKRTKKRHLLSEEAVWEVVATFTNCEGRVTYGSGQSAIEADGDMLLNKSWVNGPYGKIYNNYRFKKVSENVYEYESDNVSLGIQVGTFHVVHDCIYSKFKIKDSMLNGFELVVRSGSTCHVNGALYDEDRLVNTWSGTMKKIPSVPVIETLQ